MLLYFLRMWMPEREGNVLDKESGLPIQIARVSSFLVNKKGKETAHDITYTDSNGRYMVGYVNVGGGPNGCPGLKEYVYMEGYMVYAVSIEDTVYLEKNK